MAQNTEPLIPSHDDKHAVILAFFEAYQLAHNRPPTIREVADLLGTPTTSVARHHLNRLVDLEKLKRRFTGARRYYLPSEQSDVSDLLLDVRQRVAAGEDADGVLRTMMIDELKGVERQVYDAIDAEFEITADNLAEYLQLKKKRLWSALDHLIQLDLITRVHSPRNNQFTYRTTEWDDEGAVDDED